MSKEELEKAAKVLRHDLGSIDFSDIYELEKKILSEGELKERAADVELFYKKWGRDFINRLIFEQLKYMALKGVDPLYASGIIAGITIVDKWFKEKSEISLSRHEKPEEVPPIGEMG